MSETNEPVAEVLAETNGFNYSVWRTEEPDGEITYQLQLNNVTIHFFEEEWTELLQLINLAKKQLGK